MLRLADHDQVLWGDCLEILPRLPDEAFQLVYIDPPFNTGKVQQRKVLRTLRADGTDGDRTGFGGRRYATTEQSRSSYADVHDDYLGLVETAAAHARRLLAADGTLYFHIDYREAHYCKVLLDDVLGRECFLNEIIWAYDYGGRPRDRWPPKHDTILVYARTPGGHYFDREAVDRIPYMAPGLVSAEKAARGKLPTDVWWHTIVPTGGAEKTGYPNQKPEGILRRVVQASSAPGRWVLDFFAGSGTTGAVARQLDRRFVMVDSEPAAIDVMAHRLGTAGIEYRDAHGNPLALPLGDGASWRSGRDRPG